ncbi:MAG: family transcriptional regulator [Actinomycetia bacterium]|nr:family transcriptional regulator [Actinomycetes bacterium]
MVTFLFTDLEDSTRMWDEHPDAMRAALARHDVMLRNAIDAHHGRVMKTTGDGVCAVFATATYAVMAAADVARAFSSEQWQATGPLRVRTALHTGTADERDGDYFGPSLNRASRLMTAAHGGQVVLSATTTELVRPTLPDALLLVDLGEHRLRGLAQPERVYELAISGVTSHFPPLRSLDAFPGALALPAPAFSRDDEKLAGRASELDRLERVWEQAAGGTRHVALLAGEPGIGKTRLAGEFAARAHAEGAVVLYGRCDEEAIVPYQPFVEALRPCIDKYSPSALHERLSGLERDLARIFPELLGHIPESSVPVPSDPEAERYRLFEAVTTLLTGITATQHTVLILDDLHWADKPTLLLFRHLMRSAPRAALLIVACYRDVDLEQDHPFADLLADLRRERFVTKVTLSGLSEEESGQLLSRLAGHDVAAPMITALYGEANGNPFFLEELLHHLVEARLLPAVDAEYVELGALDLPDSVREVVARRLRRLPAAVNDALSTAAIIGRRFDAMLVAHAAGQPIDGVLASLDRAVEAGLVDADAALVGCYAFAHALIRQTVNAELGTARRAQIHAAVGKAMEEADGSIHRAAELALHFTEALPLVGARKAITYTTQAGLDALADFAFEDAVAHFEHALRLLEQHAPHDKPRRAELLTDLASALVYVDEQAGVETALRAVNAARNDGSPAQFGRAVAVFVEPTYGALTFPGEVTKLFDEARSVLDDRDPALRARLLAFEAFKYAVYQLRGRDGRRIAEEAVALARASADSETLADALFALAVSLEGSVDVAQRVALGNELVALGQDGSRRAPAFGLRVIARAYLELGDAEDLSATISEMVRIGDELRWLPAKAYAAQWRATQALVEGRFEDAHSWGNELRRYARAYRGAAGMHTVQAYYLAREEGGLGNLGSFAALPDEHADNLYAAASFALAQLESGDRPAAQRTLASVAARDLLRRDDDCARGAALGMFAEIAANGDMPAEAEVLLDLLTPFTGRLLCVVLGLACLGAADRYIGMLSAALGREDGAEAHFERALVLEDRIGGRALLPRTRYWQARFYRDRGRPGDERAARDILARVADETSQLAMPHLHAQAEELLR